MLQGRRRHQNQVTPGRVAKWRSSIRVVNSRLQWKYATLLGLTCLLLVAAFALPTWYFIQQNYSAFEKIAYDTHPGLVAHLEREKTWIACLLFLGSMAAGCITALTTMRMTTILMGPLTALEKHMRKLIRGDWSQHEFRVRENDELRELTGTYAYMYRTLRAQAEAELKLLEKIIVDPKQIESNQAWANLMNLKRRQLGFSEIEFSQESVSSRESLRAS